MKEHQNGFLEIEDQGFNCLVMISIYQIFKMWSGLVKRFIEIFSFWRFKADNHFHS